MTVMFKTPRHPAEAPRYAALYDPATLLVLGLVGAGVSAAGAVAGGISQSNAANAAADYAKKAAAENARRQSIAAQQQIDRARANYGASGVTAEGSPLDVLEQSA